MNTETQMNTQTQTIESRKNPYTPPRLINYGKVRSLTQTGSKPGNENQGNIEGSKAGSDRIIKENTVRVGVHPLSIGVYLFNYKPDYRKTWGYGRQFGVMADEVEMVMPEAVTVHPDGYKVVNYTMLGISRTFH